VPLPLRQKLVKVAELLQEYRFKGNPLNTGHAHSGDRRAHSGGGGLKESVPSLSPDITKKQSHQGVHSMDPLKDGMKRYELED